MQSISKATALSSSFSIRRVVVVVVLSLAGVAVLGGGAAGVTAAEDGHYGSTRNIVKKDAAARKLIDLNSMSCTGTGDADGSVVCEFRIVPQVLSEDLYEDCVPLDTGIAGAGSKLCIETQIYVQEPPLVVAPPVVVAPVPESAIVVPAPVPPVPVPVPQVTVPVVPQPPQQTCASLLAPGGNDKYKPYCPRIQPQTGNHCGGWIPKGKFQQPPLEADATAGCCPFTDTNTICFCDRNTGKDPNDLTGQRIVQGNIKWNCFDETSTPAVISTITVLPNSSNQVQPLTPQLPSADPPINSSTFSLSRPINKPECPATLAAAQVATCSRTLPLRCAYYNDEINPTYLEDCRCDSEGNFSCRAANAQFYMSFSF